MPHRGFIGLACTAHPTEGARQRGADARGKRPEAGDSKADGGGRRGVDLSGWLPANGAAGQGALAAPCVPLLFPPTHDSSLIPALPFYPSIEGPDDFDNDVRRRCPDRLEPLDGCQFTTAWAAIGHVVGSSPQHRTIPRRRRGGFLDFPGLVVLLLTQGDLFLVFFEFSHSPNRSPTNNSPERGGPTRPGGMRFSHGFGMTTGRLHTSPLSRRLGYSDARARIGPPCKVRAMHKLTRTEKGHGPRTRSPLPCRRCAPASTWASPRNSPNAL